VSATARPPRSHRKRGLSWVTAAVLAVLLTAGFLVVLLAQVFFRYVLNAPLSWSEEVAMLQFVWAALLLSSYGVRERFHIRLSFLVDRLRPGPRNVLERLGEVAIVLFGGYMTYAGVRLVDLTWGNTSAAVGYPIQYLYLSAPCCGALIVLHSSARLLNWERPGDPQ
jgi:TRAP-type C4-dicarboxylate transport system permease small subunit